MSKKFRIAGVLLLFHLALTGCWDQRLLKDSRLIYSSSFDLIEDDKIFTTAITRDFHGEMGANVEITGEGKTIRETRMSMDRKINGNFEPSKNRVFLLGEDLAKKDIYQFLDVFYRDPSSSISAKIAVAEGRGSDFLSKLREKNTFISEFLTEAIESAEGATEVEEQNLQTICTLMFDPGKDFILPLFTLEDEEINLEGNAIFHKHSMTGKLSIMQSTLYLVLADKKAKRARFISEVEKENKSPLDDYISYNIIKPKAKMKILSDSPDDIKVEISLKAGITISEYPADKLKDKKNIKKINKKIEKDLVKRSKKLVETIQTANADLFGIGRELIAFHPKTWEKLNWEEDYKEITIIPKIETEIVGNGIIN
ncbi:Ger(x)C family spore germination protein [Bacillus sp. Marseille-Q1617]|uniref:Ger(x)C family spore germination protein n=1 Tax=Bacillus sp. Marseille-Q1617 TaxID=2736887 RepID=UPI00158BBBBC|nr:Ger(x)C family spore germination protein [Bacillus sp. Marseille-Q1617]